MSLHLTFPNFQYNKNCKKSIDFTHCKTLIIFKIINGRKKKRKTANSNIIAII